MTQSITTVDDARLIELIRSAERRLVLMAPGVSDAVAAALCHKWVELGADSVSVILDVDGEVCRLGYGSITAIQRLEEQARVLGTMVSHQPGARIGLMATEATLVVFSPTPLLVEAGPRTDRTTNAIQLTFVPEAVKAEVGMGDNGSMDQTVGLDRVPSQDIDVIAADLERNPPMKFDVARTVRVFNAQFEFVELTVTGYRLSRKSVTVPADLSGLDEGARRLLRSSFRLVEENGALSGDRVARMRRRIAKRFLINLEGYGTVVLRSNKASFVRAVERLKRFVGLYQEHVEETLQKEMDTNCAALVDTLLPTVRERPPSRWRKFAGNAPDEQALRSLLKQELSSAYGSAGSLINRMQVTVTFKGVTYESLTNPAFVELVTRKIPNLPAVHEEYDAARAITGRGEDMPTR